MVRFSGRLVLTALIALAMTAAVIAAFAQTGKTTPKPQLRAVAEGSIAVSNSRDARAIFNASDFAPGHSTSGDVTLTNTGSAAGALSLVASEPVDKQSSNGGVISRALQVTITDVSEGSNAPIYEGSFDMGSPRELLTLVPGDARTYRFDVALPDAGAPLSDQTEDNAYQQASASVDYTWALAASEAPDCGNEIFGNRARNRLVGTSAGDRIRSAAGADVIDGKAGNDCIDGGTGADRIAGGSGNDRIAGAGGADVLFGGGGNDTINARAGGADVIGCGPGKDQAKAGPRDHLRNC